MSDSKVEDVRTVAVLGANGSGKTTLVDALMFAGGANSRQGSVDQGTSLSDTDEEEKARKISIRTTSLDLDFKGKKIFLLDTPGYVDFWGEVVLALEVADSVVIVLDGVSGLDAGTQRVWETARQKNLPVSFFITKLDKEHAAFAPAVEGLEGKLGGTFIPLFLPDGNHPNFSSVHGLREEEKEENIEESLRGRLGRFREKMIEAAAETEDALIEKYLEDGKLEPGEINRGFQKAFSRGKVVPVFCGAPLKGTGVKEFLQGICDFYPSPQDRGELKVGEAVLPPSNEAPFCARVFKCITDPFVGQLSYVRVWSGSLKSESEVYNSTSGRKEKIGHLYLIRGKEQQSIPQAPPGYIVALPKLKETSIGDTLCLVGKNFRFPRIQFPTPTAMMAVYATARGDEDKISEAFHKFTEEDPTLIARRDPLTKEFVLSGLGDVQIQVAIERLRKNFHVDVELRQPKVAYKETIKARGETKYRHKKQTGGAGQFAEVWMHVQPYIQGAENAEGKARKELINLPWGGKLLFVDEVVGGHIPAQLVQSVKKGYLSAMGKGVLANFPVVDVTATVYDGKTHPVDSKDIAFQIAGREGFKEASRDARPVLLEPIMNVAVTVSMEYVGSITGDLNSRRGRVLGMNPKGAYQVITAQVPMAELLKYSTELRSITGGTAEFTMELDHYEEVPANIAQKVVAEKQKKEEAE